MGEFLRTYKPPSISLNATVNHFLSKPVKLTALALANLEVQFPDVSFYQGDIDYEIMGVKTDAIIIRAGQNKWIDTHFNDNYRKSKEKGLLVGAYWFFDGRASPGEQAQLLITLLTGKKLELEVYIDWEHNYGGAHEGLRNVVAMMELVEQAGLNIKGVGLYTGYYFFRSNSNPIVNASQYNYLKTRPLWEAWYTREFSDVLIPAPWEYLNFWQWGTPAWAWGQETIEIDMNLYYGSRQEFEHIYGESGDIPMADYALLEPNTFATRSIRAETTYPNPPHILGTRIGQINAGSSAKANVTDFYRYTEDIIISGEIRARIGDVWWKVYESNGVAISGWVAEKHLGQTLLTVTLPELPPPVLPTLIVEVSDTEGKYIPVTVELKPK
jgi:GH25 family lysozyme M1 (1,4-beta-N-acetylmuramidase)